MADRLTEQQTRILARSKAEVERLLGKPLKIGYWTTPAPPRGADRAAIAKFKANTLDEIWVYATGRVHFSLAGEARKVDNKTRLDLPRSENFV